MGLGKNRGFRRDYVRSRHLSHRSDYDPGWLSDLPPDNPSTTSADNHLR